jgi:hypothetical protein
MKRILVIAALLTALPVAASHAAAPAPCEKMLNDVRAALGATKLGDADKAKIVDLQNKGIERCKADDDAHADEFFAAALKALGK